jgi:hypothetical protein
MDIKTHRFKTSKIIRHIRIIDAIHAYFAGRAIGIYKMSNT